MAKFRTALVTASVALTGSAALAQPAPAPSQVQPPVISAPQATTRITLPQIPAGGEIPATAKKLAFILTALDIEGEFDELAAERRELASTLLGKRITVADLFELANRIQQLYVRAGYPLARVVILPQELDKAARVKLRVVDGFVERIDASALAGSAAQRVGAVLAPLLEKRRLTQAELERRLLIAGEAPGLVLNATFAGGKQVGGSILVVSGRYRPVSASLYFDNAMPKSFGTVQGVSNFSLNNLTGFGEQLSVSAAGYPDKDYTTKFPTRRYLSATLSLPLGIDGLKAEFAGTDGRTTPRVDPAFATQGQFRQARAKLAYDLLKRRDYEMTFSARFDATDEETQVLVTTPPTPLSLDRVRVLRAGLEGVVRIREAGLTVNYAVTYSHGLKVLGARSITDATPLLPLSRQGADAEFDKLDARIDIQASLPENFYLSLGAAAQTSFDKPLLTSEQFGIVGANMLSGFTAGAIVGDNGWVARGEFGHTSAFPIGDMTMSLSPYLFGAYGERGLNMPTILERAHLSAVNYGAGVRTQIVPQTDWAPAASGFIEYSRREASDPIYDGWRIFAGASLRY
jgi:hemolysin activation/secretion protein